MIRGLLQRVAYASLRKKFSSSFLDLKECQIKEFTQPFWEEKNKSIEELFIPRPPFDFLSNQTLKDTMFVDARGDWLTKQLRYLEESLTKSTLLRVLREDSLGNPPIIDSTYKTSHNSIHHLYHWIRYTKESGTDLATVKRYVEWGGGYGNMAKILFRMLESSPTYIIIDTPLFSCLQWIYLSTTLGLGKVNLILSAKDEIVEGSINLLPICFINELDIEGQLFVSTWGLSESSEYSQNYVTNRNWFGAQYLLIGFQDSTAELPSAERLGELAEKEGAKIIDIEFIKGNHYAFK